MASTAFSCSSQVVTWWSVHVHFTLTVLMVGCFAQELDLVPLESCLLFLPASLRHSWPFEDPTSKGRTPSVIWPIWAASRWSVPVDLGESSRDAAKSAGDLCEPTGVA